MDVVLENLDLVRLEIKNRFSSSPLIIRTYTKHLLKAEGKYIRALSLLSVAQDEEGQIDPNAILVASAIEILHLATLVHDDVMDEADERRGMITLHKKYGRKTAIITGDYLLAMALQIISEVSDRKKYVDLEFDKTMMDIALGELNQHVNNGNFKLSEAEYMEIIAGKTAALFEASFYAGALLKDADDLQIKLYRSIGHGIGMIFQLMDDALDYQTSRKKALKPVVSDFDQGVVTLPLIHAMSENADFHDQVLKGRVKAIDVQAQVLKYGGIAYTMDRVRDFEKDIRNHISQLESGQQEAIESILEKALAHGVL